MEKPPLIFANRVIRQLVDHQFSDGMLIEPADYASIRVVFRQKGGSWESLWHGDFKQLESLNSIVLAWGKMPGRKSTSDILV